MGDAIPQAGRWATWYVGISKHTPEYVYSLFALDCSCDIHSCLSSNLDFPKIMGSNLGF